MIRPRIGPQIGPRIQLILKVDFRKDYFQLFLRYFSLQMSVIIGDTTYLFTADGKLRKHARL